MDEGKVGQGGGKGGGIHRVLLQVECGDADGAILFPFQRRVVVEATGKSIPDSAKNTKSHR